MKYVLMSAVHCYDERRMADAVIVGCFFIFLSISVSHGGLPGLVDPDEGTTHGPGSNVQLLEDRESLQKMMVHQPRYKCHLCEPPDCEPGAVCTDALFCYKASVRDAAGDTRRSRGCSAAADHAQLTCRHRPASGVHKRHAGQLNVTCCAGDLCNGGDFPPLAPAAEPLAPAWPAWAGLLAGAAVAAAAAVLLLRRTHRLRASRTALHKLGADAGYFSGAAYSPQVTSAYYEAVEGSQTGGLRATAAGDSTLREYLQGSGSSGSGAGLPLMVQRTLARQVALHACVGKGRYGEVWRGLWRADTVAVKITSSRDEAAWRRESELYAAAPLRHEHVLAYVGSDLASRGGCTQLWIVTDYHPLGSLHGYLARNTLDRQQMLKIVLSVASGLLHLHTDIHGTQGKPAIAHRDIRSKNILVKSDGECCLAEFGLAATAAHLAAPPARERRGSPRHMAPELLDDSMDMSCLEAHQRCDIYSLALVLWEVYMRVEPARPAAEPYGFAGDEPSVQHMRKIVCGAGARPPLPARPGATMAGLARLIGECWRARAAARLPALRVRKTLLALASLPD